MYQHEANQQIQWQPDILGPGFEMTQCELHADSEGRKITTIVRHNPANDPQAECFAHNGTTAQNYNSINPAPSTLSTTTQKPRFAFLAIHGWNDYFYQVELARAISAFGGKFYAVDLAKYGRSHLPHQMWGYTTDLSDYDEDIHAARDVIYRELPSDTPLILYGHSTGGLTTALWAHRHPGALTGLLLNSPWLEIQAATVLRQAGQPAIEIISRLDPTTIIPSNDDGCYQRSLTGNHLSDPSSASEIDPESDPFFTDGWKPDLNYRHYPSFPVRAGWLNAILRGHEQVAAGLQITAPILTLTSDSSYFGNGEWDSRYLSTDGVLRVDQIWKRCLNLGNSLTLEKSLTRSTTSHFHATLHAHAHLT
ncbi:alpha/beta hydrolase [Arcanobacterium hippocoleae]|uniref:alpha/beta hydrolase n=1 Tax=Arcanobacterium hippocoleae TaxID=149017 RepID=UPI00334085AA